MAVAALQDGGASGAPVQPGTASGQMPNGAFMRTNAMSRGWGGTPATPSAPAMGGWPAQPQAAQQQPQQQQGGGATVMPNLLGSLFPNGIPQALIAQSAGGGNVQAPNLIALIQQAAGLIPQVGAPNVTTQTTADALGGALPTVQNPGIADPRQVQAGTVSPTGVQADSVLDRVGGQIGPQALVSAITGQMQPEFTRENRALTESLANAGITGGSTAGAVGDLAKQQEIQLASTLAPFEQNAQQMLLSGATTDAGNTLAARTTTAGQSLAAQEANQSTGLQAGQTNAGNQLQTDLARLSTGVGVNETNVANALGVTQADLARALQASTSNQSAGLSASGANASNALGAGSGYGQQILAALQGNQQLANQNNQFNTSAINAGTASNIDRTLNAAQYDTGSANTLLSQILGFQNQDWLAQLGLQGQLATGAAGGQTGAFQPVFTQPAPTSFAGLASAFAGAGQAGQAAPPAPSPYGVPAGQTPVYV